MGIPKESSIAITQGELILVIFIQHEISQHLNNFLVSKMSTLGKLGQGTAWLKALLGDTPYPIFRLLADLNYTTLD